MTSNYNDQSNIGSIVCIFSIFIGGYLIFKIYKNIKKFNKEKEKQRIIRNKGFNVLITNV
jgi:hypothetical protein